ncbi:MAG: DUF3515 family protein [Austwickia sp.]|jgi:hypothetical protein|nr:DUF3515 family protein [Austwickia sp.]MBK8436942.1 DUF3515 family protein [Austwickia sp.]MBK9100569.1 DUF3515 family protein [Austwickia sp.]
MPGGSPQTHLVTRHTIGLLIVLAGALAACSGRVEVALPVRADDPACARVGAHWPERVMGRERAATTAEGPAVAAWGDPALIARCGLQPPGPTTDPCIGVDGVDWVSRQVEGGTIFLTYGRDPAIQVLVPTAYAPAPMTLPAFADAARQIPQGPHRCS